MLILKKTVVVALWGEQLLERDVVQLDDFAEKALLAQRIHAIALANKHRHDQLARDKMYGKPTNLHQLQTAVEWWEAEVNECKSPHFRWTNALWYEKGFTDLYDHEQPAGARDTLAYRLDRLQTKDFDEALLARIEAADQRYRTLTVASTLSFADLIHDVPPDPDTRWYYYRQPFDYSQKVSAMSIAQWIFARWHILEFLRQAVDVTAINPDYVRLHIPEFLVGMDVVHKSLGKGCLETLNTSTDSIVVNFGNKGKHKMSLNAVRESLSMVPAHWLTCCP